MHLMTHERKALAAFIVLPRVQRAVLLEIAKADPTTPGPLLCWFEYTHERID